MGILKSLKVFSKKEQQPAANVQTPSHVYPLATRWNYDTASLSKNISEGYEGNSLIGGACMFWQTTFSQAKFITRSKTKKENANPEVEYLLKNPNPEQTESDLKLSIITNILCGGETFILAGRNATQFGAKPVQLWNFDASLMQPIYNRQGFLSGYKYENTAIPGSYREYGVNDVIHLKWVSRGANNANKGLSPIQQVFKEINTDNEAGRSQYSYLKNDLLRGKIALMREGVKLPGKEKREEMQEFVQQKSMGDLKGTPFFLAGIEQIIEVAGKFDEINISGVTEEAQVRVARAFGISPIILEWTSGLKRTSENNVKEADKRFNTRTFAPFLDILSEILTSGFKNRFGFDGDYEIGFDVDKLQSFIEIKMEREDHDSGLYTKGAITFDELRERLGLPLLPGGAISNKLRDNVSAWQELRSLMNNYMIAEVAPAFGLTRSQCMIYAKNLPLGLTDADIQLLFPDLKPEISTTEIDQNGNPIPAITEAINVRENI